MSFLADRVKETTTTTGTGTVSLGGAATGFRTFVQGIGGGNQAYYVIEDGTGWEVGRGTVTDAAPDTLSRDQVFASTNGGAAVNWGAGTRNVFCAAPATVLANLLANDAATGFVRRTAAHSYDAINAGTGLVLDTTRSLLDVAQWRCRARDTPNMTVKVEAGILHSGVVLAAQNTATIAAPATNPRIDLVQIDRVTGAVGVTTGTEAASPVQPALPAGKLAIAAITLATSTTTITQSLIADRRSVGQLGLQVVSQADAEGGTATDERLWTALRVRQAILPLIKLPRGHLAGLGLSNGADAAHDIDIAAGEARDGADSEDMALATGLTKRIDAAWSVGTNQGGLDTGTVASGTWYHVHLIKRTDSGVVDALYSASPSAPTMPTNYDKNRRIGSVRTDASANIIGFSQEGDDFLWDAPPLDVSTSVLGTSSTSYTLSAPTGLKTNVKFAARTLTGSARIYIRSLDQNDEAPPSGSSVMGAGERPWTLNYTSTGGSSPGQSVEKILRTNTSAQIAARSDQANSSLEILTIGYTDRRGRDD